MSDGITLDGGRSWGEVSGMAGKTAIVLGTADGIGRAVALGVAATGARVVCVDVNPSIAEAAADQIRQGGGEAAATTADVTDRLQVRKAVAFAAATYGSVNYCVDVVGAAPLTPIVGGDDEIWDLAMNLNLRQAYQVLHGFGKLIFVRSHKFDRLAFTDKPTGKGRDHSDGNAH